MSIKKTKYLIHQSGKEFKITGTSKSSSTSQGIVNAHISNYFNKNKVKKSHDLDTQQGFIQYRMLTNLSQNDCKDFNDARKKTINEFTLINK